MKNKTTGQAGERMAAHYLRMNGYSILECNFAMHRVGEIDIVAKKGEFLVCVEVKTRYSQAVPMAALVPRSKQRKIVLAARHFVQLHRYFNMVVRFDVVLVDLSDNEPMVAHFPNAFYGL